MSDNSSFGLRPLDFSDVGNADLFKSHFAGLLIYIDSMGWLNWEGKKWEPGDHAAAQRAVSLSDEMLYEAAGDLHTALHLEADTKKAVIQKQEGAKELLDEAKEKVSKAKAFYKWAQTSRSAPRLKAMLELSSHYMVVPAEKLDADPFLLNTPDGEVDLRTGALTPHDIDSPSHYCTKMTAVSPGPTVEGVDIWGRFLETVCCGDHGLANFIQQVAGMSLIGHIYHEGVVIAYGAGRNGKSTLFNALATVLGDYAGSIDPKVLTTERQNKGAALATLRGKRLVLASELEEYRRLSTSTLKQLASTDTVTVEQKYRAPEDIKLSHTLVLFTNFLPRVGSTDDGTWRRIAVVPFNATIPTEDGIQDYAQVLAEKAGSTILSWAIQGAAAFVRDGFKLHFPDAVQQATDEYRRQENWLLRFIEDRCTVDPNGRAPAHQLYEAYRSWANETGDYVRREVDFSAAMEKAGYKKITPKNKRTWLGVRLPPPEWFGANYASAN